MKKAISLFLVMAMMLTVFTVSFNASFSVSDKDEDGNTLIWSAKDAIAAYEAENGEEVTTKRIYFQMPNGSRGAAAAEDHSVTITDYAQATDPETGEGLVDEETGEPIMEAVGEHEEIVIHAGEKAPSWYNDFNVLDGHTYAACYWWGGTCDPEHNYSVGWCGYRAEIADEEQGIYYVDLPDDVTTIIWNNGVNGGMDSTQPIYYKAAQTIDTNAEGAYEGDYDTLPYGSPDPDYFENCIYIIDPDQVSVNPLTNKQTCGANWYVYYGNGCYGEEFAEGVDYPDGTDNWSDDMQDVCKNPDHFKNGVHVGYQPDDPEPTTPPATVAPEPTDPPATEAPEPTEAPHTHTLKFKPGKKATATADGWKSYFYCSECGKYFSDSTGSMELTWEQIVLHYVAPTEAPKPTETEAPKPTDPPATEPEDKGILGDADGNSKVDIVDVTYIQRVLAGSVAQTAAIRTRGDVDGNSSLESVDATLLQRWLVDVPMSYKIGEAIK